MGELRERVEVTSLHHEMTVVLLHVEGGSHRLLIFDISRYIPSLTGIQESDSFPGPDILVVVELVLAL